MTELFVRQLDGCSYYVIAADGSHVSSAGSNCSCGADGMWLHRATQGRVSTSACHLRSLTGDHLGGTNLEQMEQINEDHYSVFTGRRYQPGDAAMILSFVKSGRFAAIWQLSYAPVNASAHDASRHSFWGNHAVYLSGPGRTAGTIRVGDPLADGRYAGCPDGFADWPESLLVSGAGKLVMKPGVSLASEVGPGKVYAYLTPADPPAAAYLVKVSPDHFYSYPTKVGSDGVRVISGNPTRHGTGGFSADCSKPGTVHWPGHTSRRLVQVTREASRYFGLWLNEYGQNVTVSAK